MEEYICPKCGGQINKSVLKEREFMYVIDLHRQRCKGKDKSESTVQFKKG